MRCRKQFIRIGGVNIRRIVYLTCNKKKRLTILLGKSSTTKNVELEDDVVSVHAQVSF